MGFFDRAKDNYDKRKAIAEYNYRAKECIQQGDEFYQKAYDKLWEACAKVQGKIQQFTDYKKKSLDEINRTLKQIDKEYEDMQLSLIIHFPSWESSGVTVQSWEKLTEFDRIINTFTPPSIRDFVRDVNAMEYYEAKMNLNHAKSYKEMMRVKRDQLNDARSAVYELPDFMNEEKHSIEVLMDKFRKTAQMINSADDTEHIQALKQISELIAESLTTQFLNNNYQITEQYSAIHKRMEQLNDSLEMLNWLRH